MLSTVAIIQAENRPTLDYFLLSKEVNSRAAAHLGYEYRYLSIEEKYTTQYHPATCKIFTLNDYFETSADDAVIFLDSDAWIQNPSIIRTIVNHLFDSPEKHGCFSRDTYIKDCSFVNSGSFILKVNNYTRNMISELVNYITEKLNAFDYNTWPFDQYYYNYYILNNAAYFNIYKPEVLNTPNGIGLRHNWTKKKQMYDDLHALLDSPNYTEQEFNISKYIDTMPYPNSEPIPDGFPYCLSN
jgi:hypothetical protein